MTTLTVPAPILRRALKAVRHAAATDYTRPILAVVMFEGDADGFRVVAADNYRMSIAKVRVEGDFAAWGRQLVRIDDLGLVLLLIAGKGNVILEADHPVVRLTCADRKITLRTVDGEYPNYRQVVQSATDTPERTYVTVAPRFLADAARVVFGGPHVRLRFAPGLTPLVITGQLQDEDDFTEVIMPVKEALPREKPAVAVMEVEMVATP